MCVRRRQLRAEVNMATTSVIVLPQNLVPQENWREGPSNRFTPTQDKYNCDKWLQRTQSTRTKYHRLKPSNDALARSSSQLNTTLACGPRAQIWGRYSVSRLQTIPHEHAFNISTMEYWLIKRTKQQFSTQRPPVNERSWGSETASSASTTEFPSNDAVGNTKSCSVAHVHSFTCQRLYFEQTTSVWDELSAPVGVHVQDHQTHKEYFLPAVQFNPWKPGASLRLRCCSCLGCPTSAVRALWSLRNRPRCRPWNANSVVFWLAQEKLIERGERLKQCHGQWPTDNGNTSTATPLSLLFQMLKLCNSACSDFQRKRRVHSGTDF